MSKNKEAALDREMISSVIEHMNSDHNDACLAIVRAFSSCPEAINASLQAMDRQGMDFAVAAQSGCNPIATGTMTVRVNFTKPLMRESQIRGQLVAMSKMAREKLSEEH